MRKLTRILSTFCAIVLVGGFAMGACLAALIPGTEQIVVSHHYTGTVKRLKDLSQITTVYDSAGNVIGRLGAQFREPVKLDQVPKVLLNAVIATEDRTFYKNPGVELSSVFRAFLKNLTSGQIEQGGSTITQQLVKNRILSNKRDLNRKIKELVLAYRLNDKYSKDEILEQYLNTVYFGQGSYGVKSAAGRFFQVPVADNYPRGKELNELTIGEAALLAGLIRNPEGDNPFVHPDRALRRRADVLKLEVQQGYITQAQADWFNHEPLPTQKPPAELRPDNDFAEEVQTRLLRDPRLGATPKERRDKLLQGGLKVYSTLDPALQQKAEASTELGNQKPGFTAALVAVDPSTGFVRAMVNGKGFANSQFNVVSDGAGRQMGSTWKVITLAAALANGYSPNDDVDGSTPCRAPPLAGETSNAEGGGGGTIRDVTAHSVNCAFVRIMASVGIDKVIDMAKKLGIRDGVSGRPPSQNWRILTFTLGTIEATPLEMATVTSTIAAGGVRHDPVFVQKVVGPDGKVIFDETNRPGERVLDQDVANCEIDVLHGPVQFGTAAGKAPPGHDAFGKTGTTDDKTNAAFLGGTTGLVAFVWHGAPGANVPGAGFGGQIPASIWNQFMTSALEGTPDVPFQSPGPACDAPGKHIDPGFGRLDRPTVTAAPEPAPAPAPAPVPAPAPAPTTPAPTTPAPAPTIPAPGPGGGPPGGGGGGGGGPPGR